MPDDKTIPQVLGELKDLTVTYAKQETVDPLKHLARYVGYGLGGAIAQGIGWNLVGLGVLRVLQTETGDTFRGNLAFVPYAAMLVFLGVVAGVSLSRLGGKKEDAST